MNPTADEELYERAVGRMWRAMVWLAVAGTVLAWLAKGWGWGLGFLAGAVASAANFYWLHRLTSSLGPEMRAPKKSMVVYFALRYLGLGAGGYVIVRFFDLSLTAALVGLLVAAGAVMYEVLYELLYART